MPTSTGDRVGSLASGRALLLVGSALLAVFALTAFAVALASDTSEVAAFWPAAGVASGLLVLTQPRLWPLLVAALVVVSAAANAAGGREADIAVAFALANAAESLVVALGLGALRRRPWLRSRADLGRLVGAGLSGALTAGVLVSVAVMTLGGRDDLLDVLGDVLVDVTAAHGASQLLVLPVALLLWDPAAARPHGSLPLRALAVLATLAAFVLIHLPGQSLPIAFVPFVLLVAGAQVLSLRALALQALACGSVVTVLTGFGGGPFADVSADLRGALVQLDLVVIALVTFTLGLAVAQAGAANAAVRRDQVTLQNALEREGRAVAEMQEVIRVRSEFLTTVSHELRTPLTSVQGFTEMLLEGTAGPLTEEQRRALQRIERGGQRLGSLIDNVLSMSSRDAVGSRGIATPIDVAVLLDNVAQTTEHLMWNRDVALTIDVDQELREVRMVGHADDLERAVLNLVHNGIKFTPDGGQVEVTARINALTTSRYVEIEVRDTGLGMSESEQQHVFERFYRAESALAAHVPGTGLGLAIVSKVVEDHGGRVMLTSAPGSGTCVTMCLPVPLVAPVAEVSPPASARQPQDALAGDVAQDLRGAARDRQAAGVEHLGQVGQELA
jgi:signal transduction histidine kinase